MRNRLMMIKDHLRMVVMHVALHGCRVILSFLSPFFHFEPCRGAHHPIAHTHTKWACPNMGYTVDEITLNSYFLIFFPYFSPWFNFNPTSLHRVFKAGSGWLGALGLGEIMVVENLPFCGDIMDLAHYNMDIWYSGQPKGYKCNKF